MTSKLPTGFKTREEYNAYMRVYKQKRWEDISLLLDFFRREKEFHVFIKENPLYVASVAPHGVETFSAMARKVGLDPRKMRHYYVKLVEES